MDDNMAFKDDEKDGAPRDDSLAALALLGLMASMPSMSMGFPNEQLPCVFDPRIEQAKAEDIEKWRRDNMYLSLQHNPGKKYDDGKVFIDHTSIMLALGRAKHNDETGWVEPVEPDDDDRDWFSGVGGDTYD